MKTLKLLMMVTMIGMFGSTFAQSTKSSAKSLTFFVKAPHTHEQCMQTMVGFKDKGDAILSKFQFGCMSGDHTGYAFIKGTSAENVRLMLPVNEQKSAEIAKVDQFTTEQIEKLHKEHM